MDAIGQPPQHARRIHAQELEAEGDSEGASKARADSLLAAGSAAIEKARTRSIRTWLESADYSQMARLYDSFGKAAVVEETVIASDCGSFGQVSIAEGEQEGTPVAPLALTSEDERKRRCRAALLAAL